MPRLTDFFAQGEVRFKPQSVKGNRALAVAYIDARLIQERLDDVLGPENWQDDYEFQADGNVLCRLQLKLNGEWVMKTDVGGPSDQPDKGDKAKAAVSDALKRAAVKFGIGRYLYRLPAVWADWDAAAKQWVNIPQLPAWAKPKFVTVHQQPGQALPAKPKAEKPRTGAELVERLKSFEAAAVQKGWCKAGELLAHVSKLAGFAKWPTDLTKLNADGIDFAINVVKDWHNEHAPKADGQQPEQQAKPEASAPPPAENKGRPNAAAVGVRQGVLNTLKQRGEYIEREYKESLDKWLGRQHDRLTFAELESKPEVWDVGAISALAEELKKYIDGGIPY